jgi:hypothetical protein
MVHRSLLFVILTLTPFAVSAQERISIDGDVKVDRGTTPDTRLEVVLSSRGVEVARTRTDFKGKFSFFNVAPGPYRILVRAPRNGRYKDGSVDLVIARTHTTQMVTASVLLEAARPEPPPGPKGGTVAVGEIQTIPREAQKLYENGTNAAAAGHAEQAVAYFRAALQLAPDYLFAMNDLGSQLIKLDRLDQAVDVLRKATEVAPRSYSPRVNLGVALLSAGKPAEARAEVAIALDIQPDDANALYVSGQIERALGNPEKAIAALDRALLQSNGRLVGALIHLGRLYEETGNRPKAIEAYRTYLGAGTDGPSLAVARERLAELEAAAAPAP